MDAKRLGILTKSISKLLNLKNFAVIVLFLNLLPLYTANAQGFPQKPLADIIIIGNSHTNEDVIKRELLFSIGDIVSDSLLNESKKRLLNLLLFNRVEFYPLPGDDEVSLLITVTERLYFFPYPEIRIEERDWDKVTYGAGVAHSNFRGRNEKLYAVILFGYKPGFHFTYVNPWINRKLHLTLGIYLKKYRSSSHCPVFDFEEKHLYTAFSIGKYWTRNFTSSVSLSRDEINVDNEFAHLMQTSKNSESNYSINFSTFFDNRDLYAYPSSGWNINFRLNKKGFFVPEIDYWQYSFNIRKYHTWKPITIASRVFLKQSIGELPVYDKVYFGYNERIRGYFFDVVEGKHCLSGNIELRFPLMKLKYFTFPTSVLPDFITKDLFFGINGGVFFDSGIVWHKRTEFTQDNFLSGFGAGLHIRLPYVEVLRIDAAFNENLEHQYIVEIGMAF